MRVVALIENTSASEKLGVEHGLSLYVENSGERYLIDTGASDKFITNAQRMRISLEDIDKLLISHNHYDHTGGIEALLKINPDIKIYTKKDSINECYVKYGPVKASISQLGYLYEENRKNFILYNSFQEIGDGFFAMSNEHFDYTMYCEDKRLYAKYGGKIEKDDFRHESFFVIFPDGNRNKGCVVISACSHSGIVNILKTVRLRFPDAPIISVIGGFHIMGSSTRKLCCSQDYLDKTVNELMMIETGAMYTCHCTGLAGYSAMKARMGDKLQYLQTGEELEF